MKPIISLVLLFSCAMVSAETPNLIVIMADDLGYADVGFNGCEDIPTPGIDSIAENGVRCSSGYVAYPVCGPSRASFITGRYGQRFGFERNPQYRMDDPNMGVPLSEETIASALKKVGYQNGIIGKWHLGAHETLHPLSRGFDYFYGHLGGGHSYLTELLTIKTSAEAKNEMESYRTWTMKNHEHVEPKKYLTDEFSDEAVSFIQRNKENPFFLFLSYNAPHTPLQATQEYLDRFPEITDERRKTYAAMVSSMDDGVVRVMETLKENGLEENTIVFFLSDNGGAVTKNASQNTPLRGAKGDAWEGGYRVPYAVQWKGTLPAGQTYDLPVSSLDIFGTIAGITGAAVKNPLDGVNLIPYLKGEKEGSPHKAIYLRKYDQNKSAIRSGDHKVIIKFKGAKPMLYNVAEDIGENNDLAQAQPEKVEELREIYQEWNAQLIDPIFKGLIHTDAWKKRAEKKKVSH